jgi:uracil-DNA glycosylase
MTSAPVGSWPHDPANSKTKVAETAEDVVTLSAASNSLADLDAHVSVCRACPRLVQWRESVAETKRRSFADQEYWGRPVTGFGPSDSDIVVLGLAPAAHGGNRTGRVFTGDRSGDWLYRSMYRAGLARIETSTSIDDGQELLGVRLLAAVRCAPPENAPTPQERDACSPWLDRELALLPHARIFVALGNFAWTALLAALSRRGSARPTPKPVFTHGAEITLESGEVLLASFHPSQQNTFTGRLTEEMLDGVFARAAEVRSHPTFANR